MYLATVRLLSNCAHGIVALGHGGHPSTPQVAMPSPKLRTQQSTAHVAPKSSPVYLRISSIIFLRPRSPSFSVPSMYFAMAHCPPYSSCVRLNPTNSSTTFRL